MIQASLSAFAQWGWYGNVYPETPVNKAFRGGVAKRGRFPSETLGVRYRHWVVNGHDHHGVIPLTDAPLDLKLEWRKGDDSEPITARFGGGRKLPIIPHNASLLSPPADRHWTTLTRPTGGRPS
jgi:hypothetical protein